MNIAVTDDNVERVIHFTIHGKSALWGGATGLLAYGVNAFFENETTKTTAFQIKDADDKISGYKKNRKKSDKVAFQDAVATPLDGHPGGVYLRDSTTYSTLIAQTLTAKDGYQKQLKEGIADQNSTSLGEFTGITIFALAAYKISMIFAEDSWKNWTNKANNAEAFIKNTNSVLNKTTEKLDDFKNFFGGLATGLFIKPSNRNKPKV